MSLNELEYIEKIKEKLLSYSTSNSFPHAIILESQDIEKRNKVVDMVCMTAVCGKIEFDSSCQCGACLKVKKNIHPDVIKIGSDLGPRSFHIEQIRKLRETVYIVPNEGNYKVYVLENAENMTVQAQNALLKILEEPPRSVIFILTCNSSLSLLSTVRSRCQQISIQSKKMDYSKPAYETAKKILGAVSEYKEYEILIAVSLLAKNKELFREVLACLLSLLREAYVNLFEAESSYNDEELVNICNKLPCSNIIKLMQEITTTKEYMEQNINFNLLLMSFCMNLYRISID